MKWLKIEQTFTWCFNIYYTYCL